MHCSAQTDNGPSVNGPLYIGIETKDIILNETLTVETKVKTPGWLIPAAFHVENTTEISPSEIYEFFIVLISKFIKKRTL